MGQATLLSKPSTPFALPATNPVRQAWDRLKALPGGRFLFSKAVGVAAPYTGSMGAVVEQVRPGHAEVRLDDRRAVRNHLQCIHAVALTNLAELTGNLALGYSLPDGARFIVAGMSIDFHKKARGAIRARCDCPVPTTTDRREYPVEVVLTNADDEVVATATLRTLVGPAKPN